VGNTQNIENDVIDLRELVQTIKKSKKLIYIITGAITILAILYAFVLAKPVYEVKAVIELGKINAGTKEEAPLGNIYDLKQRFEHTYGIHSKNRREYPKVKSISIAKKSESIFTIIVEGRDNESTIEKINKVVNNIENTYAKKVKIYIDTQNELISLTSNDILISQKNLNDIQDILKDYNTKMLNISKKDAALAGLYTIQISQNQARLQGTQSRLSTLKAKEFKLKLSIAPLRITQTHIIGNLDVVNKPIKPKKALIVIVSFITALMFSIFLIFFLAFIKGLKDEQ